MNIVLRPLRIEDTSNIVKWRNRDDVKKNLFTQSDITEEQHLNYYHDFIETKKVYQFIIVADGVDCGTTFLKNIDYINKRAEFGIFIGDPSFRGKGVGSFATSKTIEIGFNELFLNSIYLTVFSENKAAINSYKKAGFKIVNSDQKHFLSNGSFVYVSMMEINKPKK